MALTERPVRERSDLLGHSYREMRRCGCRTSITYDTLRTTWFTMTRALLPFRLG
jgi:hypothetical protein